MRSQDIFITKQELQQLKLALFEDYCLQGYNLSTTFRRKVLPLVFRVPPNMSVGIHQTEAVMPQERVIFLAPPIRPPEKYFT
jgi:hypothetical protein